MAHIQLNIADGIVSADRTGKIVEAKIKKQWYEVMSVEGLFKNGKHYKQGDRIELVEKAASNFILNNEIKKTEQ